VIIGTGLAGLSAAYHLAKNPNNQITILERNDKPYQGASHMNGNWLPVDFCNSWTNVPWSYVYQASIG
jgi:glycine/D-amino acid oxidase-like deaminating enzyme